jgi:hypothetical protein
MNGKYYLNMQELRARAGEIIIKKTGFLSKNE